MTTVGAIAHEELREIIFPLLLCWLVAYVFRIFSSPKLSLIRTSLVALIGWLGFCLVLAISLTLITNVEYNANQEVYLLLLNFTVFIAVVIFPLKYISRFSFLKTGLLSAIFWILQFYIMWLGLTYFHRP